MMDSMIYVSEREYETLRWRTPISRAGWWLSGFAAGFLAAAALGYAGRAAAQEIADRKISAEEITVVDGDTVRIEGEAWRLLGYDTPETYHARCDAEYGAGIMAKQELEGLIRLAKKIEPRDSGRDDRYGRVLGRLILDGEDVAEIMIRQGLARRYDGRTRRKGWCGDGN